MTPQADRVRAGLSRAVVGGLVDSWSERQETPHSTVFYVLPAGGRLKSYTTMQALAFCDAVDAAERVYGAKGAA